MTSPRIRSPWRWGLAGAAIAAIAGLLAAGHWALHPARHALPPLAAALPPPDPAAVARGEGVARAGHCAGCHTARGGEPWAGGRELPTPFGSLRTPNLTPDPATGLGRWSREAFVRALREGRSADGRRLVPACPYPNFAHVADADLHDLHAYLRSLPPVATPAEPSAPGLRFPYGTQPALALWQALHLERAAPPAVAPQGEGVERGEYLVRGLGHCSACHGWRDAWGATAGTLDLRGGLLWGSGWYAPALDAAHEAGLAGWPLADAVALLHGGRAPQAGASGPMALVVANSLQHLPEGDVRAIARFLQALPPQPAPAPAAFTPAPPERLAEGERLYARHCAQCHGADGQGVAFEGGRLPALAGNRAVLMASPVNAIRSVLAGGYGPATAAQPLPEGMPPFATLLDDAQIAAILSFVRSAWGHRAAPVGSVEVGRQRGGAS